jgi:hypothetical protein
VPKTTPWDRNDTILVVALSALAAVPRAWYVAAMELAPYDPWRHLLLVDNLRQGGGFSLFVDQPYIWYQPLWYLLCSLAPAAIGPDWIAALCSVLCVPAFYLLLRSFEPEGGRGAPIAAALLAAGYGPLIAFTCHYGPESFALLLMLSGMLLFICRPGLAESIGAGLLLGLALTTRMNFVFGLFLMLPFVRRLPRAFGLGAGMALPMAWAWWRNSRIIAANDYLFTWDGLATPAREFDLLSTLVIQMHPDIESALRQLHDLILPRAEWTLFGGPMFFLVLATICVAFSRRWGAALAVTCAFVYFTLFDGSGSARFFRIWVGIFPALFVGIALVAGRLIAWRPRAGTVLAGVLVATALLTGATAWTPPSGPGSVLGSRGRFPLSSVTPPVELLTEDSYMVNSAFYHPESLIYAFPEKRFIGLPLRREDFDDFREGFPEFSTILWHEFSVQDELLDWLVRSGRYQVSRRGTNDHGRTYLVLVEAGDQGQVAP